MSRLLKLVIPNISPLAGKENLNKFIEIIKQHGGNTISSYRDPESKKMILTFNANKLQKEEIELALNELIN